MAAKPAIRGGYSVVIATYNRGAAIAKTLDSVFAQTLPAAEVVVVDDCSPDDTGGWVRRHYPDVRVVRTPRNVFTSAARNYGARAAQCPVLLFLDHDDELMPHAAETLLGLRDAFPEAKATYADHTYRNFAANIFYSDHHSAQPSYQRMREIATIRATPQGRLYGREMYYALLRGNILQQPWAVDRATFLSIGGFAEDIRYCEDWDLYTRLCRAVPVALSDRVISHHNIEGSNLHLVEGQEEMHRKVLMRRLREARFDPRARLIIDRKLGMLYKSIADRRYVENLVAAWGSYWPSLGYWPFDRVVAARTTVICPFRILKAALRKGRRPTAGEDTAVMLSASASSQHPTDAASPRPSATTPAALS